MPKGIRVKHSYIGLESKVCSAYSIYVFYRVYWQQCINLICMFNLFYSFHHLYAIFKFHLHEISVGNISVCKQLATLHTFGLRLD